MAKEKGNRRAQLSKEVEEIKRLRDINRILKAGDLENALLSNSAKDSETLNDNVLDQMLSRASSYGRGNEKGLDIIEKLTTNSKGTRIVRQKSTRVSSSKGKVKVKRNIHMIKKKRR